MVGSRGWDRVAPDGSPYPDRSRPSFETDVRAMFSHIVRGYEGFDHIASLGNDFLWRPRSLWALERHREGRRTRRILDVGCGTGEFTRLAAHRFPSATVWGVDFTPAMVAKAARINSRSSKRHPAGFSIASVRHLPFRDASFDVAISAFVVRNLPSIPEAFQEIRRILAPDATLLTLEITEPVSPFVRSMFHAHFDHVVPMLGAAVGSAGPYQYLPDSLRRLPDRDRMLAILRETGFARAEAWPQTGSIVTSYVADVAANLASARRTG